MSEKTRPDFQIKLASAIQQDGQLLDAVTAATDYFIEQYATLRSSASITPPTVEWEYHPQAHSPLQVIVTERDDSGYREVFQSLGVADVSGTRERNVSMLRLWRKLLDLRSAKRISIIEQLLRQAEEQEGEGGRGVSN